MYRMSGTPTTQTIISWDVLMSTVSCSTHHIAAHQTTNKLADHCNPWQTGDLAVSSEIQFHLPGTWCPQKYVPICFWNRLKHGDFFGTPCITLTCIDYKMLK